MDKCCKNCYYLSKGIDENGNVVYTCDADERYGFRPIPEQGLTDMSCNDYYPKKK